MRPGLRALTPAAVQVGACGLILANLASASGPDSRALCLLAVLPGLAFALGIYAAGARHWGWAWPWRR